MRQRSLLQKTQYKMLDDKQVQRQKELLLWKSVQNLEWYAKSCIGSNSIPGHSPEDVLSLYIQKLLIYYHNQNKDKPQLELEVDEDFSKLISLTYCQKNGQKSYIPENKIRAWLKRGIQNDVINLRNKENKRQIISLEDEEYRLSKNGHDKTNTPEWKELDNKLDLLKDRDRESARIIQLKREGYHYREMIPILVQEGLEKLCQDPEKLEAKLRKKHSRAIEQLRKLYNN